MKTDEALQHDVFEELAWDASIDAAQIGVTAREGGDNSYRSCPYPR